MKTLFSLSILSDKRRQFNISGAFLFDYNMANKKSYLIRVWDNSGVEKTDKVTNLDVISIPIENKYSNDGFDLVQERIIKCYENNIKNLRVPKGFRCTYEEIEEKKTTTINKARDTSQPNTNR